MVRRGRYKAYSRGGSASLGNRRQDLVARKFSALARFGTLDNLDLYFVRIDKIETGDTKTSGCNLLDR